MSTLRRASAAGRSFPYNLKTTCFIEVHHDGSVTQGGGGQAYQRALNGESRLFAVWPGQWSSDLFVIDDLDEYAKALGIKPDSTRSGLAEHAHIIDWEFSDNDNLNASYVHIRVQLQCGCTIKDLKVFAQHMRQQKGWDIATTAGWGSSGLRPEDTSYGMKVRRKSLN